MTRRNIMQRAWEIRREAASRFGCRVTEIYFGECLRMAWAESRAPQSGMVSVRFGWYNERRYSRPWGATLSVDDGELHYHFNGQWMGDADNGGEVIIANARPGQIVAFGQKDGRKPRYSTNTWYEVTADLTLHEINRVAAFRKMAANA